MDKVIEELINTEVLEDSFGDRFCIVAYKDLLKFMRWAIS